MRVPLTVNDFLERAELVYGDRVGLVDEPDQPAPSRGVRDTWREVARRARAQAAGLDALGIGAGERVAIVSQNSARLFTSLFGVSGSGRVLVPINFRLNADEVAYIVEHSGASMLLVDPELDETSRACTPSTATCSAPTPTRSSTASMCEPRAVERARRGRDRDDQLHERHDGAPEGRADDAPQHLGERDDVRLAGVGVRPRRVPPHAADVPLQRLGHDRTRSRAWAAGTWCCARSTAPRSCGASSTTASRCSAARPRSSTRCSTPRRNGTGDDPGPRPHAHRRGRRAAADAHDRAGRDRARLGVHPDLRAHRDVAAAHDEPRPRRVRRRSRLRSARESSAGRARPRSACGSRIDDEGEVLAASNVVMAGYWEQPEQTAEAIRDGWFHTGDGGMHRRRALPRDRRPQEGRDHLGRRERVVDRGRGLHLLAPGRRRGRGGRRPAREVGRDGDRARGRARRARR